MTLSAEYDTRTVQDLADLYGKKRLNLSPAFQRQSVWRPTARRLLVQSLLDGVPIPSIFLYRRSGARGRPVYDVIDGKQRLETILLFQGKGPLGSSEELRIKRNFIDDQPLTWWNWQGLDKDTRHIFLSAKIPTIEVQGEFSEIIDLFVRINSTGMSLTAQEKRHAHYYTSPVLKTAQRLADDYRDYFLRTTVLGLSQIQRMKHVELITELLLAINAGTPLNKKTKIDGIIRGDAIEAGDLQRAANELVRALTIVNAILPDLKTTRFCRLTDFYSLVILVYHYRDQGRTITAHDSGRNALAGALLRDFGRGVDEVAEQIRRGAGATALQEPFRNYWATVREGTDSAAQRKKRQKLLDELLDGVFDDLAAARVFNPLQRRILWHASTEKQCAFCEKKIARWEDLSIDHIKPYILGGKTELTNGAIAHKKCNSAAGVH